MLAINAVISIVIVAAIIYLVGFQQMVDEIRNIDLFMLFLSILFLFFLDLTMSLRIDVLLKGMNISVKYLDILKSHFVGMLAADFTPARSGYFATAATLKYNYDVPSEKAMLSIFGPQIFDFALKLIAGTIAVFYIAYYYLQLDEWWMLSIGLFVMIGIISIMLLTLFSKRFIRLFSFAEKIPFIHKFYAMVGRMQEHAHVVHKKTKEIVGLMLVAWCFKAVSWYFAAKAIGITVDTPFPEIIFYFFLQPLLTMLEFIPSTTIAGLGLSEGAATVVFPLFGVTAAKAITFALVVRFKTTLLHIIAVPEALKIVKTKNFTQTLSQK